MADPAKASAPPRTGTLPDGGTWVEVRYEVEPNYAGWRLDLYLCEKIRRLSRARVQQIIEHDLLFERPLKPSSQVTPGMRFGLRKRVLEEPTVTPLAALREVFLDDTLLVLDKPAGLPIHPTARYHHNTLVAQLKLKFGPDFVAHPAHRIDRETSGLLVCARTTQASQRLMVAFASAEISKEYLAICEGHPPEDTFEVDAPIAEGTALIRIAVRIDHAVGKPARTRFEVLERFSRDGAPFALLRCVPQTGRQHQIRIHLKTVGFPLVGDKMYGPDPGYFDRFSKRALEPEAWAALRLERHALHAARLSLVHPGSGERVHFSLPLADDLEAFRSGRPVPRPVGEDPTPNALEPEGLGLNPPRAG